jgi:hypothetical protein
MTDEIKCNLPFERVPVCACDPGVGPAPSKQQQLECKLRGGQCSLTHVFTEAELTAQNA